MFATIIDGHTDDIPGYLASNYKRLYHNIDDKSQLTLLEDR